MCWSKCENRQLKDEEEPREEGQVRRLEAAADKRAEQMSVGSITRRSR